MAILHLASVPLALLLCGLALLLGFGADYLAERFRIPDALERRDATEQGLCRAWGESRTRMTLRSKDFESFMSAIPSPGRRF